MKEITLELNKREAESLLGLLRDLELDLMDKEPENPADEDELNVRLFALQEAIDKISKALNE